MLYSIFFYFSRVWQKINNDKKGTNKKGERFCGLSVCGRLKSEWIKAIFISISLSWSPFYTCRALHKLSLLSEKVLPLLTSQQLLKRYFGPNNKTQNNINDRSSTQPQHCREEGEFQGKKRPERDVHTNDTTTSDQQQENNSNKRSALTYIEALMYMRIKKGNTSDRLYIKK